jgi:hypothetical protein
MKATATRRQDRCAPAIARTAAMRRTRPRAGFVLYGVCERCVVAVQFAPFIVGREPTTVPVRCMAFHRRTDNDPPTCTQRSVSACLLAIRKLNNS